MGSQIRALGYEAWDTEAGYTELMVWAMNGNDGWQELQFSSADVFWQRKVEVNEDIGFIIYGVNGSQDESAQILGMTPWGRGRYSLLLQEIDFDVKREGKIEIFGEGWEKNSAAWITFHVQNLLEYYNWSSAGESGLEMACYISGLCYVGEIIAPYSPYQTTEAETATADTDEISKKPVRKKRLYEQVKGYFMQKQEVLENAVFMGEILEMELMTNPQTAEGFYWMYIKMEEGLKLEVYINTSDLQGIPAVGHRLKGACWLQGEVEFGQI